MIIHVDLCMGSSCFARGNSRILIFLESYIRKEELNERIAITGHLCLGNCSQGPVVRIDGKEYFNRSEMEIVRIIESRLNEQ